MKYHKDYEIDSSFIIDKSIIEWRVTGTGEYVLAVKNKRKYFVKRNLSVRYPNKGLPKESYEMYKKNALDLQKTIEKLRSLLKDVSVDKDCVVNIEDSFWDSENKYALITRYIPNGLEQNYDFSSLSKEKFVNFIKQTAKELAIVHEKGVIHGDIKCQNFIIVKKDDNYIPYLIDFDSSYPKNEIPVWNNLGGTYDYLSPESIVYTIKENNSEAKTITSAVDIFSLGLCFYKWWANGFPQKNEKYNNVGEAILCDDNITYNKKFDVIIGDKCNATISSLINWMLAKESSERPTAEQVYRVLDDQLEIPDEFINCEGINNFELELWPYHQLIADSLSKKELIAKKIKSFNKYDNPNVEFKYLIKHRDNSEEILSIFELIDKNLVRIKGAKVSETWPKDNINFVDAITIAKLGYAKIEKIEENFKNSYLITTINGMQYTKGKNFLIANGLAKAKDDYDVKTEDAPWPEHGNHYNLEKMAELGIKNISRIEINGEHRYILTYNDTYDDHTQIVAKGVSIKTLKIMGVVSWKN